VCELLFFIYSFFFFFGGTHCYALAKQALYHLSHTSSPFFSGYFGDGGLMNYLPGWP
jgi:hypothetical protein